MELRRQTPHYKTNKDRAAYVTCLENNLGINEITKEDCRSCDHQNNESFTICINNLKQKNKADARAIRHQRRTARLLQQEIRDNKIQEDREWRRRSAARPFSGHVYHKTNRHCKSSQRKSRKSIKRKSSKSIKRKASSSIKCKLIQ